MVIVNVRYGVKVNELVAGAAESAGEAAADAYVQQGQPASTPQVQQTPAQPAENRPRGIPQPAPQPSEQPAEAGNEEEEFDYSDFELEDEDI